MKIRLGSTELGFWRYAALWTLVALVFAMQGWLSGRLDGGPRFGIFTHLRWSMVQWYTWAVLAPWIFHLAERHPVRAPFRLRGLGTQSLLSAGVTFLAMVIGAMTSTVFEPSGFGQQLWYFLAQHFATGLLTYWALFAMHEAIHFHAEKARREVEASRLATELAQSRLLALKSQLQPHFLFNTLHAVITLLDEDKVSAEDMLLRLSDLLRAFLEDYDGQEISLREELTLIDLYLGIQRTRFKDRLTTRIHVAPDTLDCAVPSLILQPMVENAISHGIGQRIGNDCIEIESTREGDTLCLDVRNRNSTLAAGPGDSAGHGIGLSNTRLRLQALYGDASTIRLEMIWPEGVICRIRLPFRALEGPDDVPEFSPEPASA